MCAFCGRKDWDGTGATCPDCPIIDILCPQVSDFPLLTARMKPYPDQNYFQLVLTADELQKLSRRPTSLP